MPPSGDDDNSNTGGTGSDSAQNQGNTGTGTDSAQGTGNGGTDGTDSGQGKSTDDSNKTVSRDDFEKVRQQLAAADQKRDAAEKELQKIKDADLSELEKSKKDLHTLTEERDGALALVNKLRLQNAFLGANSITWQNADVALDIAQSKGYLDDAVDDKGEVDNKELGKALKKLSEDHKYLVKSSDDDDDGDDGADTATGAPAGGRRNNNSDENARQERLRSRMPALGRR